jgi:hypothetical protein
MYRVIHTAMDTAKPSPDLPGAFDSAFDSLRGRIEMACRSEDEWRGKVAIAVREALVFAAANPAAAWVLTNRAMGGNTDGFERLDGMIEHFAEKLAPGRDETPDGERLPEITERAMVSGVVSLVAQRLHLGRQEELPAIAPEAIQFVLTPYLGTEEARATAARYGA